MKTNTQYLPIAIFFAFLFGFLGKSKADNTTGTVEYNVWYDQNEKVLVLNCRWYDNQSFIEPEVYWGVNPNTYESDWKFGKLYGLQGEVTHKVKVDPCTVYYTKLMFKDWNTANIYSVERSYQTQGDKSPTILNSYFGKTGYTYALLSLELDGNCNGSNLEVSLNKVGELPKQVFTEGFYGSKFFSVPLYGLQANTQYEVEIKVSNQIGSTVINRAFMTESNLTPIIESAGVLYVSEHSVRMQAYLNTQNTKAMWRMEWGKVITFENYSNYSTMYGREGMVAMDIGGLEPNTVYYWRPYAKNDFGDSEGQTRMFKTNALAGFGKELTFDDLLKVSSGEGRISVYVEQPSEVRVISIDGKQIGTYKVADQMDLNLIPGTYVVRTVIGGKTLVKKAIAF